MAFMRHNNSNGGGRRHHHNNRHRGPSSNGGQHRDGNRDNRDPNGQRRHVNRTNHVFDSNGPEGRVRGTAAQIVEKFTSMARDAQAAGDKVLTQNYFQHAEHYQRLLNEITEENAVFEREREAQRAAQAPQPEVGSAEAPIESYAAPSAEAATAAGENASLPSFVQVPISSSAPEPGAPLPRRNPRRPVTAPASEPVEE
jgi:hypothetical protein